MNKQELMKQMLSQQKQYIGQKKDIIDEEAALMDSFFKEKVKSELSFIGDLSVCDEKCEDIIKGLDEKNVYKSHC